MNRIILSEFGNTLGTRVLGIEVRSVFNELFNQNDTIFLDFNNIRVVTNSFADELIGKKVKEIGLDTFKNSVKIINANENVKSVIKKSIKDRIVS
ncbi:hypothetical protein HMPREF3188_00094 [Tissierellia bacterium KA00581]|nr:hypothetical protein HMPREF3188_00094 [Tissierellia bacterium KA00581]DAS27402.1 MAG TPA: protein of unknown function DUF4325 [Caudoviricetes sp.]